MSELNSHKRLGEKSCFLTLEAWKKVKETSVKFGIPICELLSRLVLDSDLEAVARTLTPNFVDFPLIKGG